jgi:hypothetical protein
MQSALGAAERLQVHAQALPTQHFKAAGAANSRDVVLLLALPALML